MREKGYDDDFSAAITIASSTIGPIIPPSAPLVLYAVMANESVGRLFLGGVVPGVLMGVALMVMVYVYSRNKNYAVSPRPTLAGLSGPQQDRVSSTPESRDHPQRNGRGRLHADGGRRGGRGLRALSLGSSSIES